MNRTASTLWTPARVLARVLVAYIAIPTAATSTFEESVTRSVSDPSQTGSIRLRSTISSRRTLTRRQRSSRRTAGSSKRSRSPTSLIRRNVQTTVIARHTSMTFRVGRASELALRRRIQVFRLTNDGYRVIANPITLGASGVNSTALFSHLEESLKLTAFVRSRDGRPR